jgi:hypothetical protein
MYAMHTLAIVWQMIPCRGTPHNAIRHGHAIIRALMGMDVVLWGAQSALGQVHCWLEASVGFGAFLTAARGTVGIRRLLLRPLDWRR